jgi:hypothetical protein
MSFVRWDRFSEFDAHYNRMTPEDERKQKRESGCGRPPGAVSLIGRGQ